MRIATTVPTGDPRRSGDQFAARLLARVDGLGDTVSLVNNRNPDPTHFGDIVAEIKTEST